MKRLRGALGKPRRVNARQRTKRDGRHGEACAESALLALSVVLVIRRLIAIVVVPAGAAVRPCVISLVHVLCVMVVNCEEGADTQALSLSLSFLFLRFCFEPQRRFEEKRSKQKRVQQQQRQFNEQRG